MVLRPVLRPSKIGLKDYITAWQQDSSLQCYTFEIYSYFYEDNKF